jgi:hypothetical protein
MKKYLKETTTDWKADFRVPCHTYIFEGRDTRCVGYIKEGTTEEIMFSKPQRFDKRGRTFKEV